MSVAGLCLRKLMLFNCSPSVFSVSQYYMKQAVCAIRPFYLTYHITEWTFTHTMIIFFQVPLFFCPSCYIIRPSIWEQTIIHWTASAMVAMTFVRHWRSLYWLSLWEVRKMGLWPAGHWFARQTETCRKVWAVNLSSYHQRERQLPECFTVSRNGLWQCECI